MFGSKGVNGAVHTHGTATLQLGKFATEYTLTALAAELAPLVSAVIAEEVKRHISIALEPIIETLASGRSLGADVGDGRPLIFICDPTVTAPQLATEAPRFAHPPHPPSAHGSAMPAQPAPSLDALLTRPLERSVPADELSAALSASRRSSLPAAAAPRLAPAVAAAALREAAPAPRPPSPPDRPLPRPAASYDVNSTLAALDADEAILAVEMAKCKNCARTFRVDRLARHEAACVRGSGTFHPSANASTGEPASRRHGTTSSVHRRGDPPAALLHLDLAPSERRASSPSERSPSKPGRGSPSPSKAASRSAGHAAKSGGEDSRETCPLCARKFDSVAYERHVPVCERNRDRAAERGAARAAAEREANFWAANRSSPRPRTPTAATGARASAGDAPGARDTAPRPGTATNHRAKSAGRAVRGAGTLPAKASAPAVRTAAAALSRER
ncbi:hypothetical protein KFE25_009767 [Diacronema lutheri]|uniref:Uncharacterized protein n=1 Tax=Diacronema lutheri TaxID=2081491 RepID=A0A8J6C1U4_DIALT|nr:hypothetical protein KFE25_009767 [Diacronema lutheri]